MANQYVNKVVYGSDVLIDLTADTVTQNAVLSGRTFHAPNGAPLIGTCNYDVDSSVATANTADVLTGKTYAKSGSIQTGTMPNIGAQNIVISTKADNPAISMGYHDGSGRVSIAAIEQQKIIPGNIKSGVSILGVTGTYDGGDNISAGPYVVTPAIEAQVIIPENVGNWQYFTQVTVNAIPVTRVDNASGGVTVTIANPAA